MSQLNKNILATVIYYDGFDYPLTVFEVWKYLITDYCDTQAVQAQFSFSQIRSELEKPELLKYLEQKNGFYFLKGRTHLVSKRIAAGKISAGKMKHLRRITWLLRFVPFVKMVGITGGVAMKNANAQSDLDLLVVLKYGKIWTGRLLVTGVVHALKQRRHDKKIADRVCLNFFVTDQSLEIMTKDLFSANEYTFLFPLFGWEIFEKFQIKNQWIRNIKPTYRLSEIAPLKTLSDSFFSKNVRMIGENILSAHWIEKILKKYQKKRIMQNPKTHQEGSLVYANDDALIFLPSPHGPKIFEQFKEKLNELSA